MKQFDFSERGRVYIQIHIKPQDDSTLAPVRFKVDTGADFTAVSKLALISLGYDMDWIRNNAVTFRDGEKPMTASGDTIDAGYIQLPLVNILGYEGKHWPFQIIMNEKQDFRNLLGRDLLTGFNYWFNNDDDVFTISRVKVFKPRYTFLPNQEINEIFAAS